MFHTILDYIGIYVVLVLTLVVILQIILRKLKVK